MHMQRKDWLGAVVKPTVGAWKGYRAHVHHCSGKHVSDPWFALGLVFDEVPAGGEEDRVYYYRPHELKLVEGEH